MKREEARTMTVLRVLLVAGALGAVMVLLREGGELTSKRVSLLDLDDQAFFDSSESVANDGDKNMKKAGEDLKRGELKTALSFAKKAASEYGQSLSEDRLDAAEKVQQQIKAAIAAKKVANHEMIEGVLAEAQKVKTAAEAAAARGKSKITAAPAKSQKLRAVSKEEAAPEPVTKQSEKPDFSLATQAHLLYKDEKLLNVKAKTALAEAVKSAKAKLAALQRQFLSATTTDPADDTTKPLPKVLDCGPLSNDCNTNQGGEFYAKHKHAAPAKKAPPTAAAATPASKKARTAKLALLKRVSEAHVRQEAKELDQKGKSYNGALQLLRDLSTGFLVPKAAGQRAQALHEEAQEPESHGAEAECARCFASAWEPTSALACAQAHCPYGREPEAAAGGAGHVALADAKDDKEIAAQMKIAMARLDHEQLLLNNQRAAVFAEYVGPSQRAKKVQVQRFLKQWVPAGEAAMGSWLAVNNGGGAVNNGGAPPASPEEEQQAVVKASELRERGAGKEGLTLEQAMDPLNEQQKMLNNERQELVHAFAKSAGPTLKAFGDKKEYLKPRAAVLSWKEGGSADLAEQEAAEKAAVQKQEEQEQAVMKQQQVKQGNEEEVAQQAEKKAAVEREDVVKEEEKPKVAARSEGREGKGPAWLAQGVPADKTLREASAPHVQSAPTVATKAPTVAAKAPTVAVKAPAVVVKREEGQQQAAEAKPEEEAHAVVKEGGAEPEEGVKKVEEKKGGDKSAKGHHGMPQYNAKAAASDIESFFDDLVHKQIAVGHGVALHPWDVKAKPAKPLSEEEKARVEEDSMIEKHAEATREGAGLEEAEEQAKKGQLVVKVGNELRKKSDKAARDEIQDYFDSLGSS